MNDKEYSRLPGLRRSDLWIMNQTPAHFKYHMENPEDPAPALTFGQAAHKFILEFPTFWDEFAVMPAYDRRTKAGKEAFKEFADENNGKTWISEDDFRNILGMRDALINDPYFADIIEGGDHERVYTWTDDETGEQLKIKADIVDDANRIIYDYKTTLSCQDGVFEKSARRYGYDFQAGFYTSGVEAETLERYAFAFIVQEKNPPYCPRLYICDRGFLTQGRHKFRRLLNLYHECKTSDDWFGYMDGTLYAEDF